ncbi:Imm26 family immunity protein [Pedobacter sp. MC2016-24]|uniref:Imm26 family immunity protein n=1 Tax=Pedobacter sp. MC2016-24 TaxID=2780090 RepID=UPI00187DF380|nr:Imm26 family immunity protein [Pedobacter sp. MC2016-24]MBE9602258.1 immunity 26/phosphotriesterase HocA family protein [Pedobacter sp. MC2016-24]
MDAIELKDQQRKYFGLAPVDKNWDRITFPKGLVCYFDQNVIKKVVINSTEYFDYYSEFDTEIQTNDRSKVIPVSGKGKEKSISLAVLADYSLKSVSVRFDIDHNTKGEVVQRCYWVINKHAMNLLDNAAMFRQMVTLDELPVFIDQFIETLPDDHLKRLAGVKEAPPQKNKPVKFKSGDFFAIPTKRDLYGRPTEYTFGRHLLNISALRKNGVVNKQHHFYDLGTIVQLVTVYDFKSPTTDVDVNRIKLSRSIPPFYMMDDQLMRGNYPIIGNIPVDPNEIVFPMHYGSYVESSRKGYYFGWGMIMVDKVEKIPFKDNDMDYNYRNNGVAFGASLYQLEDLRNGLPPYDVYDDINHPDNIELKRKIFASLGVPIDIDYDDYCLKSGVMTRAELLKVKVG